MYYELKWIDWPSGEKWYGIAYTKEQVAEMIEDAKHVTTHDFEFCGYLEVKDEE